MVEDIVERKRSEKLVALGRKNLTIAQDLGISVGTVKINATRLFEKLRVPDRTEAAYRAAELVLLSSEEP
jgi:DNA-binding NarL/FixJ family response regulator